MYWNLVDEEGDIVTKLSKLYHLTVHNSIPGTIKLEFHGTRDYIDGVIMGIQLMGGPKLTPKMVEKAVAEIADK